MSMSLFKSSKTATDPSQFLKLLKEVLIKSGTPYFNFFEQQDAGEILACILDELCGDFILASDEVQVTIRVTIDCLSCHQSSANQDSFTVFQLPVPNTKSSLDLFFMPEHLSGEYFFFCNNCSSLQSAITGHGFSRARPFPIIQLKQFVNFQGTVVTKDINTVKCFSNISIPVILGNDIFEQKKFTFISTVNDSENYTAIT